MENKLKKITLIVCFFHVFCLFFIYLVSNKVDLKKSSKNISVNTIIIKEPVVSTVIKNKKNKKLPSNKEKKVYKKQEIVPGDLLEKLKKDFSILDNKSQKSKTIEQLTVPELTSLDLNKFDKDKEIDMINFKDKIVGFFKSNLNLPEYGDVKMKIKIKKEGVIDEIFVVESKSKKNEEYLKSSLMKISMSWVNEYLKNEEDVDLVICFSNEI